MIFFVSILALLLAPLATWIAVRKSVQNPGTWAAGGLGVHLVVGNVINRWIMPRLWPMPSGTHGFPSPGEYMAGSLTEYELRMSWLTQSTTVSLALGVVSAFIFGLSVRAVVRRRREDKGESPPQLTGRSCAVCGDRIAIALTAIKCSRCGSALHASCQSSHECGQ